MSKRKKPAGQRVLEQIEAYRRKPRRNIAENVNARIAANRLREQLSLLTPNRELFADTPKGFPAERHRTP